MWQNLWEHGLSEDDVMSVFDDGDFDFMETTIGEMTQEQKNLITFRGRIAENGYYYREFIYETTVPNNIGNKINGGINGRRKNY